MGWTKGAYVPATILGIDVTTAHIEYANALAQLFASWMQGYPLEVCLDNFEETALSYRFYGQDSWSISGCADLTRWQ